LKRDVLSTLAIDTMDSAGKLDACAQDIDRLMFDLTSQYGTLIEVISDFIAIRVDDELQTTDQLDMMLEGMRAALVQELSCEEETADWFLSVLQMLNTDELKLRGNIPAVFKEFNIKYFNKTKTVPAIITCAKPLAKSELTQIIQDILKDVEGYHRVKLQLTVDPETVGGGGYTVRYTKFDRTDPENEDGIVDKEIDNSFKTLESGIDHEIAMLREQMTRELGSDLIDKLEIGVKDAYADVGPAAQLYVVAKSAGLLKPEVEQYVGSALDTLDPREVEKVLRSKSDYEARNEAAQIVWDWSKQPDPNMETPEVLRDSDRITIPTDQPQMFDIPDEDIVEEMTTAKDDQLVKMIDHLKKEPPVPSQVTDLLRMDAWSEEKLAESISQTTVNPRFNPPTLMDDVERALGASGSKLWESSAAKALRKFIKPVFKDPPPLNLKVAKPKSEEEEVEMTEL